MTQKRVKRRRQILTGLLVIICAAAMFFGLFFVTDAEVVGNTRYTEDQIREMTLQGPLSYNTILMSVFRKKVVPNAAFIESVQVEYRSRNKLRLEVQEKYPIGYVRIEGTNFYFDKDGLVLEAIAGQEKTAADQSDDTNTAASSEALSSSSSLTASSSEGGDTVSRNSSDTTFRPALTDVPLIAGLNVSGVRVGQVMKIDSPEVFQTILSLTKLSEKFGMQPDYVEFAEDLTMTLHYGTVRIQLGTDALLEEKVSRVAAILPELDGLSGVLHLEDYSKDTQNIIFDRDK